MTPIGKLERATQNRIIALFHHELGYDYLKENEYDNQVQRGRRRWIAW